MDEVSSVGLVLSPGQSADCSLFGELFASLDQDNVLEAAALDKGHDSNAIRDRLAEDASGPRYEKYARTFLAMVHLAAAFLYLR